LLSPGTAKYHQRQPARALSGECELSLDERRKSRGAPSEAPFLLDTRPDGQIVLVTKLCEGQRAIVLQLPAAPHTEEEVEDQKRVVTVA
jgi:hypothetical protein